jgi:hypothetical protein
MLIDFVIDMWFFAIFTSKKYNDCCSIQINEEKEQEQFRERFRERRWRFIVSMLAALLVSVSIAWKEAHYFFLGAFLRLIQL